MRNLVPGKRTVAPARPKLDNTTSSGATAEQTHGAGVHKHGICYTDARPKGAPLRLSWGASSSPPLPPPPPPGLGPEVGSVAGGVCTLASAPVTRSGASSTIATLLFTTCSVWAAPRCADETGRHRPVCQSEKGFIYLSLVAPASSAMLRSTASSILAEMRCTHNLKFAVTIPESNTIFCRTVTMRQLARNIPAAAHCM